MKGSPLQPAWEACVTPTPPPGPEATQPLSCGERGVTPARLGGLLHSLRGPASDLIALKAFNINFTGKEQKNPRAQSKRDFALLEKVANLGSLVFFRFEK